MGHARYDLIYLRFFNTDDIPCRTYLSMDIIRRVLESYFGYKVNFVQNITDIDDKVGYYIALEST